MYCDLHTHSVYSDGSYTPAELIRAAKERNLAIALTDHNTVSGLREFMEEAAKQGVTAIPGIEFSTAYGKHQLHLVGLFLEPEHYARIERITEEFHTLKEISNIQMVERLNQAGYRIDYAVVKRSNPNGNVNRAHVAAAMVAKGYVASVNEAFDTLLGDDQPFFVPSRKLGTIEAIELLRQMKAVPILAHPLKDVSADQLRQILPELMAAGLAAMETHHSSYDDAAIALTSQIAREFGLLPSGGSDFHGTSKPKVKLGTGTGNLTIPISFLEQLRSYQQSMT